MLKTKYKLHCLRCHKDFEARTEYPGECPNCGSPNWDTAPYTKYNNPTKK